jgi:hypothetical protein
VSDGSNNYTAIAAKINQGQNYAQAFYFIGGATGSFTLRTTFTSTGATWREVQFIELTHDGTGAYDTTPTNGGAGGNGASAASGNLTAAAQNVAAVSLVRSDSTLGGAGGSINGVAATEIPNASGQSVMAYRLNVTGPFTGQATRTITAQDWICLLATFKEGVSVPALTLTLAEPVIGTSFF